MTSDGPSDQHVTAVRYARGSVSLEGGMQSKRQQDRMRLVLTGEITANEAIALALTEHTARSDCSLNRPGFSR
tara:strand:- start:380 stop:598 length:219 start_codon:yes stop_codon:yes gene_type:complete